MRFASRALVQTWWFELVLPRFGLSALAARSRLRRVQKLARLFHDLAADLGGLMIKVGQFMSSRLDVLPPEITRELEGLQDEVAPEPTASIVAQIERELGIPLDRAFASFDTTPIAAASLGQAHRARLTPGIAADLGLDEMNATLRQAAKLGEDTPIGVGHFGGTPHGQEATALVPLGHQTTIFQRHGGMPLGEKFLLHN